MLEGGFPVAAFAADESSAQETIGEAATKDDGAGEEADALDEAAADGSDEEPIETAAAEGYDADAVPSEDVPALMADDSIRSGDWSYYESTDSDGRQTYIIDHYYGSDSSITLPATLDGRQMGGVNFFYGGLPDTVTEVALPASMRMIGASAFSYTNVSSVVIPADSQLEEIGEEAFFNTPLTSFTLPMVLRSLAMKRLAIRF